MTEQDLLRRATKAHPNWNGPQSTSYAIADAESEDRQADAG